MSDYFKKLRTWWGLLLLLGFVVVVATWKMFMVSPIDTSHFTYAAVTNLGMKIIGPRGDTMITLGDFSDLPWAFYEGVCKKGGYNLEPYAHKTLLDSSYLLDEKYLEHKVIEIVPYKEYKDYPAPVNARVLSYEDRIVCIFKSYAPWNDNYGGAPFLPVNN